MSQMMPPDLTAALGGGAPAPSAGGGLPPDLGALLGGGAAPADDSLPSIKDGTHGGGEEALTAALDALQDAIDQEADQEDIQVMLQCQTKLQQILAKNQKEADSAMGGSLAPAAARKMAGGLA